MYFHIQVYIWPTKLEGTAIKRNLILDHIGYSWCSWYQRRGNDFFHIYLAINGKQLINISSDYTWTIRDLYRSHCLVSARISTRHIQEMSQSNSITQGARNHTKRKSQGAQTQYFMTKYSKMVRFPQKLMEFN